MVLSGLLSTMNVWADKLDDIRFSINDVYMTLLMTGWMFLFMGLIYREISVTLVGLSLIIIDIWCIRTQFLINETQYKLGMIPHHSMAIHMSKKILQKENNISPFLQNIIKTQENEHWPCNRPQCCRFLWVPHKKYQKWPYWQVLCP
jgi:hypothetical protein